MRASLSAEEARGLALRAQRFGDSASARADRPAGCAGRDPDGLGQRPGAQPPAGAVRPPGAVLDRASCTASIYHDRRGFEYWGHMASWLPMAEYRYFLPRMARMRATSRGLVGSACAASTPSCIRWCSNGCGPRVRWAPRRSTTRAAGAARGGTGSRPSWCSKTCSTRGCSCAASGRPGFARLYDLTERVLPAGLDTSDPGQLAATRHLLLRGLERLGVATAIEMADYFRLKPVDQVKDGVGWAVG